MDPKRATGECAGIDYFSSELGGLVFDELENMMQAGETNDFYELAYERLIDKGCEFGHADITGAHCRRQNRDPGEVYSPGPIARCS